MKMRRLNEKNLKEKNKAVLGPVLYATSSLGLVSFTSFFGSLPVIVAMKTILSDKSAVCSTYLHKRIRTGRSRASFCLLHLCTSKVIICDKVNRYITTGRNWKYWHRCIRKLMRDRSIQLWAASCHEDRKKEDDRKYIRNQ